jgi:fructokinase
MLIGIDWGGTKIEAVALSENGEVLARKRTPSPQHDYVGSIAAVAGLVQAIERETGRAGSVGIGIPGSISPATGLVRNANSTWINGQRLDQDMARALGRPVRVENDANCLAVSEAVDGAAAGAAVVWAVILGTGVGSGIAFHGRAHQGRNRIAGEWGHNPLPWPRGDERPGPDCFCGRSGCMETFVSGPGFARDHARRTGLAMNPEDIIAAMRAGDADATGSYTALVERLGRGLAHVVNVLDPDVIVLGGGLSDIDELYAGLPGAMRANVFSDICTTPILKSRHGPASGVRGAAWLWREESGASQQVGES